MSAPKSGKSNSTLILFFVLVALTGFIVVAYYNTMEEFDTMKGQIALIEKQNKREIDSVMDQMNKRYLTLLKQADDIDQQRSKLAAIDRSITAEREALGNIEDNFHNELAQIKKMGTESTEQVSNLEDKFNQEIKGKAMKLAKLEDDYQGIKNELEDQQTMLVMMREQTLLDRYKHPQDSRSDTSTGDTTATIDANTSETVTPVTPLTPVTPASTTPMAPPTPSTLVPTNNRVVTDLPTPAASETTTTPPTTTPPAAK